MIPNITKGKVMNPPRILLYGVPGIGKSTFASQAPSPIFLPCEEGSEQLDVARFPVPSNYQDVIEYLTSLAIEEHEFKSVVIDTLDKLEAIIWAEVAKEAGKNHIEEIGYAKGYVTALTKWEEITNILDTLRSKGMIVICLAHSIVKAHNAPGQDPYDRFRLALHEKAANQLLAWCDMCLFANYKVLLKTQDGKRKLASNESDRFLFTEERPAHWGKNRYGFPYAILFEKDGSFDVIKHLIIGA